MRFLSLFSGIEAASVAWHPLGWQCAGVAEIEPFPCSVLAHHYPEVPNLGDVTKVSKEMVDRLGPIDIVCGGFPCQDLSVAGQRKGLKHADGSSTRSGLFFDAMRIADWANPRWLFIENVPGMFSSNKGRDFAAVVGEMAGCEFDVPRDGWANAGVVVGPRGLVEWSVMDAQYHGLAQRRRRVFIVRDSGDWASREPIFLEPYRLQGHPAPRRETGKAAPTIPSRSTAGGGLGTDFDCDGGLIQAFGGNDTRGPIDVATGRNACASASGRMDFESETFLVSHSLRGEGFDASEDGTGRGTPLVPVTQPYTLAIRGRGDSHNLEYRTDGTANALLTPNGGRGGIGVGAIAFDCKASGQNGFGIGDIASTQRAMGHAGSHTNGGGHQAVMSGMQVRRLTPRECERLQGFPDDYTLIPITKRQPIKGQPAVVKMAADGPRYKALGNSWAVPNVRWIGERIAMVDALTAKERKAA